MSESQKFSPRACNLSIADSIMGVTFYSDEAPQEFGKFDRALITMYRLTAGDTWVKLNTESRFNHPQNACDPFLTR
jgi:hypothetical protein